MAEKYPHQEIESRWQQRWAESDAFAADVAASGEKKFVLDMFPYPSGDGLHVGHPEGYTATDIYSRFLRMNGVRVLHPMGWDAFGLPAENFAIKMGVHPAEVTAKNIANFKRQIQSLGFSYDWNREVNTTDPAYYKWTQWIFLQLFKRGLAYEKEAPIWWCPKDKTGLANEEVVNGKCDRCGTTVEKKMLKQWMLKITAYADRLLEGLNDVDWPEGIKTLQRNWIGKSEGAEVQFTIPSGTHAIILHGYTGNPTANFLPWLKQKLEMAGMSVELPALPNTDNPTVMEQVEYVEKNCGLTADTVLVGHSLGAPVAMKVIERLKHPIAKLVLAGGFTTPVFEDHERPFASSFDWRFDWKKIRKNVQQVEILHDTNDYAIGIQQAQALEKAFDVKAHFVQSKDVHFCGTEESTILDSVLSPVTVFTTRPDTLFGATYLVLSPEHELVQQITTEKQKKAVEKYVKSVAAKSDLERTSLEKEKTGVFTGAFAINPVNNEKIPVWIADYVLSGYGTGAIMAVPAHDERDQTFAKKFKLPIVTVIEPPSVMPKMMAASAGVLGIRASDVVSECWTDEGTLTNSGPFDGMDSAEAREKIVAALAQEGKAKATTQYKLRDWVFSRQRYWGEPIPLVHCEHCKQEVESTPHYLNFYSHAIWNNLTSGRKTIETRALNPEEPARYFGKLKIGDVVKGVFKPTGATAFFRITAVTKYASLAELYAEKKVMSAVAPTKTFASVKELEDAYERLSPGYVKKIRANGLVAFALESVVPGVIAVPENQLPLELPKVEKYEPTGTGESPLAGMSEWVNTACPECGGQARRETNTMPQWAGSCWYYLRFCDPKNDTAFASAEAMKAWLPVDMYVGGAEHAVLHLLYARFWHKVLFDAGHIPSEVGDEPFKKLKNQGLILGPDGEKMSKSRGNVINPDEIVEQYGADTLRMYEMFMGPFEDAKPWDTNGILGVRRFLEKVWRIGQKEQAKSCPSDVVLLTHKTIKKVTEDIENFRFNTAVSSLMIFANALDKLKERPREEFENFLWLLKPFAPHISSEILDQLRRGNVDGWPKFDKKLIQEIDTVTIAIQVMGKLRGTLIMPTGTTQDAVETAAKAEPNVAKYLTSEPKKVIFVKDKLINFVI